jgi:enamine deaminase RidA (YjgF/YER057c/UK114 family)
MQVQHCFNTLRKEGDSSIASLVLPSRSEHCITVLGKDPLIMNKALRAAAKELKASILNRFVFAGSSQYENYRKNMAVEDGRIAWLHGDSCREDDVSSMQAFAISGIRPVPVKINGREMGFTYEDEEARYCRLSGVHPENLAAGRPEEARAVFEIMKTALKKNGFLFTDTVRTWFSLSKLLEWYREFNVVRTTFFEEQGVFARLVPASTGIGAANQYGAALICDLLAVQPKTNRLSIKSVPSPLQAPAMNYKSSFSRAVEMKFPTHRVLFISGTASIDRHGKSAHTGNAARQIDLTMRVVEALLYSRNMTWNELFRGIAYFKNMDDRPLFDLYLRQHGIPTFSLAVAHRDICRSELLFEIELDAIKTESA